MGLVPHPRSVATLRSLGRAGVEIFGLDHERPPHRGYTRYLKGNYRIEESPEQVLQRLLEMDPAEGGVVIPTSDLYMLLLAKNHERLSRIHSLALPPWEDLRKLVDIVECYRTAQRCGLKTPNFWQAEDRDDLDRILAGLDFEKQDYIVRTMPGTGPANPANFRFTKVAGRSETAVRETCLEVQARLGVFPTIVEVVPGEADRCLGVSLVAGPDSEPLLAYCVRRLRLYTYARDHLRADGQLSHPYELGSLVYCESCHDEEAIAAAADLVKAAGYRGPITVEFRRNAADDALTLIKCDPRVVRATSLSTALEMDVPEATYRCFAGQEVARKTDYADGVAWLWISQFIEAVWNNREDLAVRQELLALMRNWRRIASFAFADWRDPLPFIMHMQWRLKARLKTRLNRHRKPPASQQVTKGSVGETA